MNSTKKLVLVGIMLVTCIGCDQTTKHIARSSLDFDVTISYFNDFLRIQYAENPGGMMSLGAELPPEVRFWFLTVFVAVMLGGILLFTVFSKSITPLQIIALTLIVGGGFSNLIDRVLYDGHVIDFLNIGIDNLRTAIFNFADVIILLGTILLLLTASQATKNPAPG
ncbi:MAG: signal peptidase II [Ignavibacteriae bacterium]|nr:signal peptidase II [Ignavibacteriota bacterium]